jgi:hypothetical protein
MNKKYWAKLEQMRLNDIQTEPLKLDKVYHPKPTLKQDLAPKAMTEDFFKKYSEKSPNQKKKQP